MTRFRFSIEQFSASFFSLAQEKEQRIKENQQKKQMEELRKQQEQKRKEAEREQYRKYVWRQFDANYHLYTYLTIFFFLYSTRFAGN